ncbi:MAG: EAL domain-containing protein [Bradymonadales bacterium]|nr:EAL domain-containing protein [Bradymonadales bacterium]
MDLFVARQPIVDRDRKLFGYELLFRSDDTNLFSFPNGDFATAHVINNTLFTFGWEQLLANKMAFLNTTRNVLLSQMLNVLPSRQTVVEILESVRLDRDVLQACRALKAAGYLLALDDFVFRSEDQPLIELADIIKVDFTTTDPQQWPHIASQLLPSRPHLLAEKVETEAEFLKGIELGYSYFQGYFFSKPEMFICRQVAPFFFN